MIKLSRAYLLSNIVLLEELRKQGYFYLLSQCKLDEIMYSKDTWAVITTTITSYSFRDNLRQWEIRHKIPHQYICR